MDGPTDDVQPRKVRDNSNNSARAKKSNQEASFLSRQVLLNVGELGAI